MYSLPTSIWLQASQGKLGCCNKILITKLVLVLVSQQVAIYTNSAPAKQQKDKNTGMIINHKIYKGCAKNKQKQQQLVAIHIRSMYSYKFTVAQGHMQYSPSVQCCETE